MPLHHSAMGSSGSSVWLTLSIVLLCLVYLRGWVHLRLTSLHVIAAWRAASFLVGLLLIWIAAASPMATLDDQLLTIHMIQHLLLMTLAPPLIWLGAPFLPLAQGLPRRFVRGVVDPILRWLPLQRAGKALTQPVFCWLAASAVLVVWHMPTVFALGMQSESWHAFEQATFLVTGLLFWWPVIQPWPSVSRWPELSVILYLFLATLPCDILSGFLVFCDRVVYPIYFSSSKPFGFSALGDQQCAGALMWTCVTIVYLVAGTILTTLSLSPRSSRGADLAEPEWIGSALPQRVRHSQEGFLSHGR